MTTQPDGPAPSQPAEERITMDQDVLTEVIQDTLEKIVNERGSLDDLEYEDLAQSITNAIRKDGRL
ncbi:hypothetical protein [Kitasatospora sp. NPDC058478]|uniref:hypothetical protein n=1 Tax=unclassified Kitasatospora TaxID=2633591 RepID=UPI00365E4199